MSERPLSPGHHGLARKVMRANQRQRLLVGVAAALARNGRVKLTVAHVVKEAGVSRRTFYEQFDNLQEAILASHQAAADSLLDSIARQCGHLEDWSSQLQSGLATTLDFAAGNPELARMLTLDPVIFDLTLGERVIATKERFATLLHQGRKSAVEPEAMPELTEMFLVGAISSMVAMRIRDGEPESIWALNSTLLELILTPYVGREEAIRIARAEG